MLGPVAAALPDAEVGGLDVPVVDTRPVQRDQRLEQVGAPPLQQVQGQPLAAAQHLAQRLLAGALQHQGLPAAHVQRALDQPHEPRVVQPGQHPGLAGDPARRRVVHRDLEHPGGVRAGVGHRQVRDQQADGGGPRAEAALQPEPAVDDRAGRRLQRVHHVLDRPGQGTFRVGQPLEEGPDVGQPLAHRGPGGLQHERAHRRRHLRQVRGQVEPVVPVQPVAQRRAVRRGRAAGQHVVGQRAEREHVQPDPVGVAVPHALGGLERLGQPPVHVHRTGTHHRARRAAAVGRAHQPGDPAARQPGRRRARERARAPPVTHQDPQLAVGRPVHPDRVRRQPAVHDPVPVRVRHRLGDLPQQPQLRFRGNAARVVGLPQVEPLEPVVDRVHQADAELAVDDVPRAQQPVVRQPRHDPELVLGDLADLGPLGRGRARRGDQEPDPAPVGGGHPVERRPVLPAVTLAERLLVDHPRARLPLAPLDDPDPLHQRGDDLIAVGADGLLRRGRLQQPPGDPGQPGIALGAVQAEQVHPGRLRQQAAQARVVQEDGLLHERHDRARIGDRRRRSPGPSGSARPAACWPAAAPCAAPASAASPRPGDRHAARSGHPRATCPSSTSAPPGAGGAGPAPAGPPRATCRARPGTRNSTTRGTERSRAAGTGRG